MGVSEIAKVETPARAAAKWRQMAPTMNRRVVGDLSQYIPLHCVALTYRSVRPRVASYLFRWHACVVVYDLSRVSAWWSAFFPMKLTFQVSIPPRLTETAHDHTRLPAKRIDNWSACKYNTLYTLRENVVLISQNRAVPATNSLLIWDSE